MTLANLLNYARMWLVNGAAERKVAKEQARSLSIKAPSIDMEADRDDLLGHGGGHRRLRPGSCDA